MIHSYVVATSLDPRVYHGYDRGLADRLFNRALKEPGVTSAVLYKLEPGEGRAHWRIIRAQGEAIKLDTTVRCGKCFHKTVVCRELCERETGYPVCAVCGGPMEPVGGL